MKLVQWFSKPRHRHRHRHHHRRRRRRRPHRHRRRFLAHGRENDAMRADDALMNS